MTSINTSQKNNLFLSLVAPSALVAMMACVILATATAAVEGSSSSCFAVDQGSGKTLDMTDFGVHTAVMQQWLDGEPGANYTWSINFCGMAKPISGQTCSPGGYFEQFHPGGETCDSQWKLSTVSTSGDSVYAYDSRAQKVTGAFTEVNNGWSASVIIECDPSTPFRPNASYFVKQNFGNYDFAWQFFSSKVCNGSTPTPPPPVPPSMAPSSGSCLAINQNTGQYTKLAAIGQHTITLMQILDGQPSPSAYNWTIDFCRALGVLPSGVSTPCASSSGLDEAFMLQAESSRCQSMWKPVIDASGVVLYTWNTTASPAYISGRIEGISPSSAWSGDFTIQCDATTPFRAEKQYQVTSLPNLGYAFSFLFYSVAACVPP